MCMLLFVFLSELVIQSENNLQNKPILSLYSPVKMPLQKAICIVIISTTNPISLTQCEIGDIVKRFLWEMLRAAHVWGHSCVSPLVRYCESRRRVLLQHVHEGYEKDLWEYIEDWAELLRHELRSEKSSERAGVSSRPSPHPSPCCILFTWHLDFFFFSSLS